MSGESVGQIGLDLVVNQNQFNRQMQGITGIAKKAGLALAAAFSVKKIIDFGKSCIELGSDLAEVQNVVDVTFPHMSAQVDQFAKSAAASFGLSETMAKKFTGTFGAMAKAFGFSESAAYEMGTTLTGLAGDVASFYNISQDEAYTKLKSVFTGETESLKDLGVVMTQSALDAYAMANGYGKTTQAMSEAEKVALRYAFVQNQLSTAAGDFMRTSDSWANQTKVLQLQFDSLKATIGQGLINVLTPVLKVINNLLARLVTLASAFKSFTELITGNKSSEGSGFGDTASELSDAAGAADNMADSTAGIGSAAKKASKEMRSLMGFDQINKISKSSEADGGGGGGIGSVDFGNLATGETAVNELDSNMQSLIERCKTLADLFKRGFVIGFGDSEKKILSIQGHVKNIGKTLKEIFTDKTVVDSANNLFNSMVLNAGKVAGSISSIGVTIVDNLVGGIDKYLQGSADYIKDRIVSMFDAFAEINNMFGDACADIADIFTTFANDDGKRITGSLIGIFSDAGLGIAEILTRDVRNLFFIASEVISENKEKIKEAISNTLSPIAEVAETIHGLVKNSFSKISEVYGTYIEPAYAKIKDGLSNIFGAALEAYNNYLAPVLSWIADRFSELADQYIQPLINAFLELWGKAVDAVSTFWEFISPFVAWFIEEFIAVFAQKLQWLWTKFEFVFSAIASVVQGIIEVFSGIIDFITGVFTGDWERAWNGIKEIFGGVCTAIEGVFNSVKNFIINVFTTIKSTISNMLSLARDKVSAIMDGIKTIFFNVLNTIKGFVSSIFQNGIKGTITNVMNVVKNAITTVLNGIKSAFNSVLNAIKDTVSSVFNGIWNTIRGIVNSILGGIESMVNGVIDGVNSIANAFNSMSVDIPDWVPVVGGKTLGFNLPTWSEISLPRLAQGGFVEANTPQLAMIGDNRHQGEVVAPEGKLQEMVENALKAAGSNGTSKDELESILDRMTMRILSALAGMGFFVDGEELATAVIKAANRLDGRMNPVKIY